MAAGRGKSSQSRKPNQGDVGKKQQSARGKSSGKVGSDVKADKEFGGKLDFGFPDSDVTSPISTGGREKGPEPATGPMRSGSGGTRTSGVGHAPGRPGAGS